MWWGGAVCQSLPLEINNRIVKERVEVLEHVWERVKFRNALWVSNHKEFTYFLCLTGQRMELCNAVSLFLFNKKLKKNSK